MKTLRDLETFKIPALRQDGARLAKDIEIALFSRSGFNDNLVRAASERDDVTLVQLDQLDAELCR